MPCPTSDELRVAAAGPLGGASNHGVLRHAEECPSCAAHLDRLRRGDDPLASGAETLALSPAVVRRPDEARGLPRVPGYEVLAEVGRGGMGVVYKARHRDLGRPVALKMILAGDCASPEQQVRFRVEAELAARVRHPGVVQVYEVGEHQGLPFLALEWIDGGSLAQALGGKPQPPHQAAMLVEQLARAVQAAHAQGVIHRDLKPGNVLLSRGASSSFAPEDEHPDRLPFEPKITDFGLAKQSQSDSGLTRSGAIVGTPEYMAPEQAAGEKQVGTAADIYALGVLLYECLTGAPPLRGQTVMDTLKLVCSVDPVPPRQRERDVPRDLETICLKCLHKESGNRYAGAAELADDLERWRKGEPIRARRVGELERAWLWTRRNPVVASLLAAVAVSLVGGMAISTHFAIDASRQAEIAHGREQDALAARDQAREAELDAVKARNVAATAEQHALTEKRNADLQAATLTFRLGLQQAEAGAVDRGLFLMLRAWRQAPSDEVGLRSAIRMNLAGWGRQLPRLRHAFQVDRFSGSRSIWLGDAEGRTVLTGPHEGNTIHVWDPISGRPAAPPIAPPGASGSWHLDSSSRWVLFAEDVHGPGGVFDRTTGRPVQGVTWPNHERENPYFLDVTEVLKRIHQNELHFWDMPSSRQLPGRLPQGSVYIPTRTIDGRVAVVVFRHQDGQPRAELIDLTAGKPLGDPAAGGSNPAISLDGRVAVHIRGEMATWMDLKTGRPLGPPWSARHGTPERLGRDSLEVIGGSFDNRLRQYDLATGLQRGGNLRGTMANFDDHEATVASPDGRALHTLDLGGTLRTWDSSLCLLQATATTNRHNAPAPPGRPDQGTVTAAFSPDRSRVAVTWVEKNVGAVLDARTGELLGPPMRQPQIRHIAFSPDGSLLATATHQGRAAPMVVLRDGRTGRPLGQTWPSPKLIHALEFSPDGKALAASGVGGTFVLDVPALTLRHHLAENTCIIGLSFHRAGRWLAARAAYGWGGVNAGLRVWDVQTGQRVSPFRQARSAFAPKVRWDGDEVVYFDVGGNLLGRLSPEGKELRKPWPIPRLTNMLLSPDGRRLAGSTGVDVRQWDTRTGDAVGEPLQHSQRSGLAGYSSDGKILATDTGHSIYLWDAARGYPLGPPFPHVHRRSGHAFADQDRTLLTVTIAGVVRAWPVPQPVIDDPDRFEAWLHARGGLRLEKEETVPLTLSEWQTACRTLAKRWPTPDPALAELPDDAADWHRRQAGHACDTDNERGELYHLERLAALRPDQPQLHARIAAIHARVAGRLPAGQAQERQWQLAWASAKLGMGRPGTADWDRLCAADAASRKSWIEARWHLDQAIPRRLGDWSLLAERATAYQQLGDAASRDVDWEQALRAGGVRQPAFVLAVSDAWARQGRWKELAAILAEAMKAGQAPLPLVQQRALTLLKTGDRNGYVNLCRAVLGGTKQVNPQMLFGLAELCSWAPGAVPNWAGLLPRLEALVRNAEAAEGKGASEQERAKIRATLRYWLTTCAAALHRAGRHGEAITRLEEAMKLAPGGQGGPGEWVWLALAHSAVEKGARKEASRWLAKAKAAKPLPNPWAAAVVELLLAEASRTVKGTEDF